MKVTRVIVWLALAAAGLADDGWRLPRAARVVQHGTRTYRFTVDYTSSSTVGEIVQRQRVTGSYTRGLPGGDVVWSDVSVASVDGATAPLPPGEPRAFMEGFRYRKDPATASGSLAPDFFRGFPPTAVHERNLVWDEEAIEIFGQTQLGHLKLNEPYHFLQQSDVVMPGVGTFQNRDVQLTWVGRSRRNGRDCAVISYSAYFNPLAIASGGMTLRGRSHYWGQIWVALSTRQIEYATIHEGVLGELTLPGQEGPQVIDVFRSGVFEPVADR